MKKKYEFTGKTKKLGKTILRQIVALRDFGDVKKGDLGGWIEREENLSHDGNCWIYDEAMAFDYTHIFGNAKVCESAMIYGHTVAGDDVIIKGSARVYDLAVLKDKVQIDGHAQVFDKVCLSGWVIVQGSTKVFDHANIHGYVLVDENAKVCGFSNISSLDANNLLKINGDDIINENPINIDKVMWQF